jgi:hypothetical protein
MKARSITTCVLILTSKSSIQLPGADEQNFLSQDTQLSNQEPSYSTDSPERHLACDPDDFYFPTLPGYQYLYSGTGPQTISWDFPTYDTSAACSAPPPLIGWWFKFYDSDGVYHEYDDFPLDSDSYMNSCTDIFDYTTCTSVVFSNVPWLTGTDRSLIIDTNS